MQVTGRDSGERRIAAQLYTVRYDLRDTDSAARSLDRIRSIGYQAVELISSTSVPPADLARILADTGLRATSMHVMWERLASETEAVVDECRTVGTSGLGIVAMPPSYRDAGGYRRFAAEAGEMAAKLDTQGIRLSYHNHSFELQRYGHRNGLDLLVAATAASPLMIQLDTYWLQYGGATPATWIRELSGRVSSVHLKDMDVELGEPVMAEVGEGNLDWPAILAACDDAHVEHLIVEQDVCRSDPYESLAISFRNLERMASH